MYPELAGIGWEMPVEQRHQGRFADAVASSDADAALAGCEASAKIDADADHLFKSEMDFRAGGVLDLALLRTFPTGE